MRGEETFAFVSDVSKREGKAPKPSRAEREKKPKTRLVFAKRIFRGLFAPCVTAKRFDRLPTGIVIPRTNVALWRNTELPDRCLIHASGGDTPRSTSRFGSDAREGARARPRARREPPRWIRWGAATRTLRPWDRVWSPGRWVLSHTLDLMSAPVASLAAWPAPPPPPLRWRKEEETSASPRAKGSWTPRGRIARSGRAIARDAPSWKKSKRA
jgi:hypothetical protein